MKIASINTHGLAGQTANNRVNFCEITILVHYFLYYFIIVWKVY